MSTIKFRRSRNSYPKGVIGVYDNGGKTWDRYTVIYAPVDGVFPYVGMSESPFSPQGFGQHGEMQVRMTAGWGSGEKVIEFEELPEDCQRLVRQDLLEVKS